MKRSTRLALACFLLALLGIGYRACVDDAEPAIEEEAQAEPLPTARASSLGPPSLALPDAGLDSGTAFAGVLDAGLALDAGLFAPPPPDAEAYMAQWKAVLKPLLRQYPPKVKLFRAVATDGGAWPSIVVDAGVRCEPGVASLDLRRSRFVDVVVFIDTSGSMFETLDTVAWWLGTLQARLEADGLDVQLLVVADQKYGRRRRTLFPPDASVVDQVIESHDIFEILLKTGWAADGWREKLRPQVPTELVLVTDDSPMVKTHDDYERLFLDLLGPTAAETTRLHLVGGFEHLNQVLLNADDPIATQVCSRFGVSAGKTYQTLTTLHSGLRASVCRRDALAQLVEKIVEVPAPSLCLWTPSLPPGALPERLQAINRYGQREWLVPEPFPAGCMSGSNRRGYFTADEQYALCPLTCDSLRAEGFRSLELPYLCR